jgi:hypothetical protein
MNLHIISKGVCLVFFLLPAGASFCQRITLVKSFGGTRFEMDTLTLSPRQVLEIVGENQLAYDEFKRAKLNYSAAGVLGFTSVLLVAVPLVTVVAGGQPEWGLAAAGGVLVLATVPLTRAFQRHAQNALEEYNKKFEVSRIKSNLYFTGTGVKLVFRF